MTERTKQTAIVFGKSNQQESENRVEVLLTAFADKYDYEDGRGCYEELCFPKDNYEENGTLALTLIVLEIMYNNFNRLSQWNKFLELLKSDETVKNYVSSEELNELDESAMNLILSSWSTEHSIRLLENGVVSPIYTKFNNEDPLYVAVYKILEKCQ